MATQPIALEGLGQQLIDDMRVSHIHEEDIGMMPDGHGWLVVEYGGDTPEAAEAAAREAMQRLTQQDPKPTAKIYTDPHDQTRIWRVRESGLGATAHIDGKALTWEGWEDSSVPPQRLGAYLRKLRALLDRYGYTGDLYGHFGQGCVHTRIDFGLRDEAGIEKYRRFAHEAAQLVVSLGGSISGEHGVGWVKRGQLQRQWDGAALRLHAAVKQAFDPKGLLNPGKKL
jgi:FAD/FMN-containing dehydrogenase